MTYFFAMIVAFTIGAYVGFIVFQHKNRDPTTGAVLGGISGIFPILLLVLVAAVMFLPALESNDQGFVSKKKLGSESDVEVEIVEEPVATKPKDQNGHTP